MVPYHDLALLVRQQRSRELLQEATLARLQRAARRSSIPSTHPSQRLLPWLGTLLIQAGCLLQRSNPPVASTAEGCCP